jgi:hypothetical protein
MVEREVGQEERCAKRIDKMNKLLAYLLAVVCAALGLAAGTLVVKLSM